MTLTCDDLSRQGYAGWWGTSDDPCGTCAGTRKQQQRQAAEVVVRTIELMIHSSVHGVRKVRVLLFYSRYVRTSRTYFFARFRSWLLTWATVFKVHTVLCCRQGCKRQSPPQYNICCCSRRRGTTSIYRTWIQPNCCAVKL